MIVREELNNILNSTGNVNDLTAVINKYVTIEKEKEPTAEELTMLTQLVSRNGIMMNAMIENIVSNPKKYNLDITILLNKEKEPIKFFVEDV